MRRLDMSIVKEILRLKYDAGLSLRDIAASCNCGKSTVDDILVNVNQKLGHLLVRN